MARLDARRWPALLLTQPTCRVVLLFGADGGLVRDRARDAVAAWTGSDPLRLVEAGRDAVRDTGALAAEAATLAMTGGSRVVRVREATDGWTDAIGAALAGPGPGVVVAEAGDLPLRSKLRVVVEGAEGGLALDCAPERGDALRRRIKEILAELGVEAEPTAVAALAEQADDRSLLRRELERLALQVGPGGCIQQADVAGVLVPEGESGLDDAVFAALLGDAQGADHALRAAVAEGASAVQIVRAALRHAQRLEAVLVSMGGGATVTRAIDGLRPPAFGGQKAMLAVAARRWTAAGLGEALEQMLAQERSTKSTGVPDMVVARQLVLGIALQAMPG